MEPLKGSVCESADGPAPVRVTMTRTEFSEFSLGAHQVIINNSGVYVTLHNSTPPVN